MKNLLSVLTVIVVLDHRRTQAFRTSVPTSIARLPNSPVFKRMVLHSSVGDGDDKPPSGGGENRKSWDDFLNRDGEESDNLLKAREYMSENSLPISYDPTKDDDVYNNEETNDKSITGPEGLNSSALVSNMIRNDFTGGLTQDVLSRNPYMAVVSKLSPSDLISKFTATAHPRVQNAIRSTILGLIGGLPKMAFDTTTITTGQKLASLMFQLQMTGYMFKVRWTC